MAVFERLSEVLINLWERIIHKKSRKAIIVRIASLNMKYDAEPFHTNLWPPLKGILSL